MHGMMAANVWHDQREANLLDGAAPFYGTYRCADGNWISVGSIEPQFYTELCNRLRVCDQLFDSHANVSVWPAQRAALEAAFATHPLNHWVALFEGTDACVAPVLSLREEVDNAHLNARGSFVEFDGVIQPAPAPRLLSTPGRIARPAPPTGQDETSILRDWLMASAWRICILNPFKTGQ